MISKDLQEELLEHPLKTYFTFASCFLQQQPLNVSKLLEFIGE